MLELDRISETESEISTNRRHMLFIEKIKNIFRKNNNFNLLNYLQDWDDGEKEVLDYNYFQKAIKRKNDIIKDKDI